MKIVLIVLIFFGIVSSNPYRLKSSFKPIGYSIQMSIPEDVLTTPNYNEIGLALTSIFVDWVDKTDKDFQFHADTSFLKIRSVTFDSTNKLDFDSTKNCNDTTQICTVTLPENIQSEENEFILTILYDLEISSDMLGLYKSSYVTEDDKTEYFLATQFEPTYARRVFPCLDEPSFKAKFNFIIKSDHPDYQVLTNSVNDDITFVSPKMPTYSVAFVVSKFTSTGDAIGKDGTSHKIWSRKDFNKYGDFALSIAPKIMDEFGDYLGKTYYSFGINKSDEVALPTVDGGAMENWGLVTFSEPELLFDEEENSTSSRLALIETMVHEYAHMWFGNWVTLNWWDVTFLNEGFANYFQYFTTHKLYPEFEMDKQFVVDVNQKGLEADAKSNTKALQSKCDSVAEINSKFNGINFDITYFKGASIVKMVKDMIGEDQFKQGLQKYVKENRNVRPKDLWDSLIQDKDFKLDDIMNEWITTSGFPLVQVSLSDKVVELSQTNFQTGTPSNWTIPIYFGTSKNYLLFRENAFVAKDDQHKWLFVRNSEGFYRVNYDDQLWDDLIKALENNEAIDDSQKSQIVDDIFALGRAGKMSYSKVFEYLEFLKKTDNYYVWVPAFRGFEYLLKRIGETTNVGNHIINLMKERMSSFNVTNSISGLDVIKNSLKFEWLCRTGNDKAIKLAREKFSSFLNDNQPKEETDLREVVYCYGQTSDDWTSLFEKYNKSSFAKRILLKSLACGNEDQQSKLLEFTKTNKIASVDKHVAFRAVLKRNVNLTLEFFVANAKKIETIYAPSSISTIISSLADALTNEDQIDQLKFAQKQLSPDSQEILSKSLKMAEENLKWAEKVEKELKKYFGISSATSFAFNLWLGVVIFMIGLF